MQRITTNTPRQVSEQEKALLLTIAANFERRASDVLENYGRTHKSKNKERYEKMLVQYTIWRDAARVLEYVVSGEVTLEKLKQATVREKV